MLQGHPSEWYSIKYAKPKRDSAGSQNPTPVSSHVLRDYLSLVSGSGNESGVDWRSTEETDQEAPIVNSIDNCGTDSIRVVH